MQVTRFPCDPGPAAWNSLLPVATPRAPLDTNINADWLVIGAGFAGLSAARRLAQLHPSETIVVLDASRVAEGPAGRNSGFMIDVPHDLTSSDYAGSSNKNTREVRLNRAGIAFALEAAADFNMDKETIATSGKINGAMSQRGKKHNDAYARHLDVLSEPYERLSAGDMEKITGTHCYIDGLYSPGTAMIQPAKYIRALAQGIESTRLSIFEDSAVLKLEQQQGSWRATTAKGSVSTARVILCVNGHLESFGYNTRELMHVFTYASMTRALNKSEVEQLGGEHRWALTPADALGTTVRRISGTGGDRIIIRNRATFDASMKISDQRISKVARNHDRSFRRRFPMLQSVEIQYRWGGRLCLTRNNVSVFGEIEKGLFSACCQNGLGTAKGTVSGKLAAELASGHTSALLNEHLAAAKPQKLPPEPVASLAGNTILRWGEYRAGIEL